MDTVNLPYPDAGHSAPDREPNDAPLLIGGRAGLWFSLGNQPEDHQETCDRTYICAGIAGILTKLLVI